MNTVSDYYHSPQSIVEAATLYSIHGSFNKVGRLLNIPYETIRDWNKNNLLFQTTLDNANTEQALELTHTMKAIVRSSYTQLQDRINNGDTKAINRDEGVKLVRVPMSGRDLAIAAAITIDKGIALSGIKTHDAQVDKLASIAEQLERVALLSSSIQGESPKTIQDHPDIPSSEVTPEGGNF